MHVRSVWPNRVTTAVLATPPPRLPAPRTARPAAIGAMWPSQSRSSRSRSPGSAAPRFARRVGAGRRARARGAGFPARPALRGCSPRRPRTPRRRLGPRRPGKPLGSAESQASLTPTSECPAGTFQKAQTRGAAHAGPRGPSPRHGAKPVSADPAGPGRGMRWARARLSGSVCSAPPCAPRSPSPRQAGPNPPGTPGLLGRDAGNVLITSLSVLSGLTGASLGGQQGLGRGNERRPCPAWPPPPGPCPACCANAASGCGRRGHPAWERAAPRQAAERGRDAGLRDTGPVAGRSADATLSTATSRSMHAALVSEPQSFSRPRGIPLCVRPILLVCPSVAGPCAAHTCWQCRRRQDCVSP